MDFKTTEEHKVAIEEEKLRVLGDEVNMKTEHKFKIMFMNPTGIDARQVEYLELTKAQIIAPSMGVV